MAPMAPPDIALELSLCVSDTAVGVPVLLLVLLLDVDGGSALEIDAFVVVETTLLVGWLDDVVVVLLGSGKATTDCEGSLANDSELEDGFGLDDGVDDVVGVGFGEAEEEEEGGGGFTIQQPRD